MRFLLMFLVGVLLFTSGCATLDLQRRDERTECRHRLPERIVEYVKPGPLVWGGLHPIPQPPRKPYQGPVLSGAAEVIVGILSFVAH